MEGPRAGWAAGPVSMPMSLAGKSASLAWSGSAGCAGEEVGPLNKTEADEQRRVTQAGLLSFQSPCVC